MFDDEMVRLAAEMSLMDDTEMDFNPYDLEDTRKKIKKIENMVDEHLIADQVGTLTSPAVTSDPISNAQIREIFAVTEVRLSSKGSAPQLSLDKRPSFRERDSSESLFSVLSLGAPDLPDVTGTPPRNQHDRDETIASLRWKLKWFQNKISRQIQRTHEVGNLL